MGPGVASECIESKDGPVIWEDHFYPEIIDPETGEVLPDGEEGELVFTSLTKEALPIIRYRTRDLTRLLPPTSRSMRRMGKITGRSDDMLIIRGVNVFPTQIEELILQDAGAGAALPAGGDARRPPRQARRALRTARRRRTGQDAIERAGARTGAPHQDLCRRDAPRVTLLPPQGIERSLTGKARRVIDQRPKHNHEETYTMTDAFIVDAIRTPFGRFGGALAERARRRPGRAADRRARSSATPASTGRRSTTCYYGCANQAGEDNRNVARMAALLAGLPAERPGHHHQPPVRLQPGCGRHAPRARSAPAKRT